MNKIYIITETQEFDGGYYTADTPLCDAGWFKSEEEAQAYINRMCRGVRDEYWRKQYENNLSVVAIDCDKSTSFIDNFIKEQKEEQRPEELNPPSAVDALVSNTVAKFVDTPLPVIASSYMEIKYKEPADYDVGWEKGLGKGDTLSIKVPGYRNSLEAPDIDNDRTPKKT